MPSAIRILRIFFIVSLLVFGVATFAAAYTLADIGGDDVEVWGEPLLYEMSMDIADNGDIYVASLYLESSTYSAIAVHRSQDDGTTWELWGSVMRPVGTVEQYNSPCLEVVEGTVDKCYLAFSVLSNLHQSRIYMVSDDLADATADFSTRVNVLSDPVEAYFKPRFATDVSSFSDFFIYLVAEARYLSGGNDIIFTRSTSHGVSFELPYKIGSLSSEDRDYLHPDVSFGFGGYINVAWEFDYDSDTYDSALRFRRAANYGAAGLADWGSIYGLGTTSDGIDERIPKIQASHADNHVVIACDRREDVMYGYATLDPGVYVSTDAGATYPTYLNITDGVRHLGDVKEQAGGGLWYIGGQASAISGIHRANISDMTSWSPLESFSDEAYGTNSNYVPALALNPAQGFRPALTFLDWDGGGDDRLLFDGEWRGDPGYPVMESGFPVVLDNESLSPPALVDVDGDGDLEIVFGDRKGGIQIYRNDGTPLPGWPVYIGDLLSESPVAVGDLRNNGEMYIVVGSASGQVFCFDALGQPADGEWPFGAIGTDPAFVAIGAFGQGPYPRGIVVAVGTKGYCLSHHGSLFPDTYSKTLARVATFAPAVGDVDGDGLAEIVFGNEEVVAATSVYGNHVPFGHYMSAPLSGSPTLGDIDLDGDMEVVVPLENGELHVFDSDGVDIPGFPYTTPSGRALSTAAIAQMLGTWEPEIATNELTDVHVFWYDGVEGIGWPTGTEGWNAYGSPIIGRVDGTSADVVLGARGQQAWAWDNFGNTIPGWPLPAEQNFYMASAMGDIDLDGSVEVVLISTGQLMVVDINNTETDDFRTWPMAGHDHQRTGCSDCPEDVVTPVEDVIDAISHVSFAQPSPNPSSGSATFRFAVPGPAVVNLEVFDLRGHRVSLVTREEVGMGHHVASWGGLGDGGNPLASGVYFARLRVQGPGINEELTRKITLAR